MQTLGYLLDGSELKTRPHKNKFVTWEPFHKLLAIERHTSLNSNWLLSPSNERFHLGSIEPSVNSLKLNFPVAFKDLTAETLRNWLKKRKENEQNDSFQLMERLNVSF